MKRNLILLFLYSGLIGCSSKHSGMEGNWRLDIERQKAYDIAHGLFYTNTLMWTAPQIMRLRIYDHRMVWLSPQSDARGRISTEEHQAQFTPVSYTSGVSIVRIWDGYRKTNVLLRIEVDGNNLKYTAEGPEKGLSERYLFYKR